MGASSSGVRLLIVTQRLNYLNPTWELILEALRQKHGVVITGPGFGRGYSSFSELKRSLGPFDVSIVDPWVVNPDLDSNSYRSFRPIGLTDFGIPVVVNLMVQDPHAFSKFFYDRYIVPYQFALVSVGGTQFWNRSFHDAYARESWLKPQYLTENPLAMDDRFLLFPHCVHSREFAPLGGNRPIDVSVIGVKYCFRSQAAEVLKSEADIRSLLNQSFLSRRVAAAALNRLVARHFPAPALARFLFRRALERSLSAITCDASIGYAVRKFFEIPAAGAVLSARDFRGARELGFVGGDNSILLGDEEVRRIPDIVRWLKMDREAAMKLAGRGQELVREYHTVEKRAQQLITAVGAIARGTLKTIRWRAAEAQLVTRA